VTSYRACRDPYCRREFADERASDQVDSLTLMKPTMDEAWVPFEVIVATTHRVEKYGRSRPG